jgi:hypothetical protein
MDRTNFTPITTLCSYWWGQYQHMSSGGEWTVDGSNVEEDDIGLANEDFWEKLILFVKALDHRIGR